MRHDHVSRPVTVDRFLSIDFGSGEKYELIDGEIRSMTGGSRAHARVASNVLVALGQRLRGSGCRAYNSDAGIYVDETTLCYPDVSVMCEERASPDTDELLSFEHPEVVFEVLSPSTGAHDRSVKLGHYQRIASLQTVVHVDPIDETTRIYQRLGPAGWHEVASIGSNSIELPSLGIVLPHAEIFARD